MVKVLISPAKLALADGTVYTGRAFGASTLIAGEVVFNTSMAGYQEVLTDPSYRGQIVTMTYPLIGNTGTTDEDLESIGVQVRGFVVRELTRIPSNFRSRESLDDFLKRANVPGIEGIDTRALVRKLRVRGSMPGVLSTRGETDAELVELARATPVMTGQDLVRDAVPKSSFTWDTGFGAFAEHVLPEQPREKHVVAIDYGAKWNIWRSLTQSGCRVTVVPGTATAEEVQSHKPDGIFLSNGPGDPAALDYAVAEVKKLIGPTPLFGICLGHQLLGLALGGSTFKLPFGHRGANHPVLDRRTGKVEVTTQNHGFAVDANSLPASAEVTHLSLNDGTLEGIRHREYPAFSVQYHPEAAAGPHDSSHLFTAFRESMG